LVSPGYKDILTNVWGNADMLCVIYNTAADTTNDQRQPSKTIYSIYKKGKPHKKEQEKLRSPCLPNILQVFSYLCLVTRSLHSAC